MELCPAVELLELLVLWLLFAVVVVAVAACVEPGSARATTPAASTLVAPTAAVAERTLACPRALAATARPILSRFITFILRPPGRSSLWPRSQSALTGPAPCLDCEVMHAS